LDTAKKIIPILSISSGLWSHEGNNGLELQRIYSIIQNLQQRISYKWRITWKIIWRIYLKKIQVKKIQRKSNEKKKYHVQSFSKEINYKREDMKIILKIISIARAYVTMEIYELRCEDWRRNPKKERKNNSTQRH